MRGHVDPGSLALHAEGLLSRRRSARIGSHLSGCPACRATERRLTAVSTALGQVPAAPLPPAVAARLDLALSSEVARQATAPAAGPSLAGAPEFSPVPTAGPSAGQGTGNRRWALRPPAGLRLAAAAGVAVVLAAGGYGLSRISSGNSTASSSSGREAAPSVPGNVAGPDSATAGLPLSGSQIDYQPHTLGKQAAQALAAYQGATAPAGSATAGTSQHNGGKVVTGPARQPGRADLAPMVTPAQRAALQGCADAIAHGRGVELVDQASFAGRPALIIVVAGRGAGPAIAWVVRPGCSAAHQDKLAEQPLTGR